MNHLDSVRVRFCPSPTGTPHVGLIRTALFNWAFARHHGGSLVFRIEDTDTARDSEESYIALLDALRWLGLDWDEGPEVGGPYGPYRQSERAEIYSDVARRLLAAGEAYESFSTSEEIEARHHAAGRDPKLGYDNADRDTTAQQATAWRSEGRTPVLRLRMPDNDLSWTDLVRGEITFRAATVPDPVLVRGNGQPLYTLTNPVDDALMRITHVLRGEDPLPSTPRQLGLYAALERIGVAAVTPAFGHLPYVLGEGNRKLSKRDPQSNLFGYRDRGFLPEGLLNYLALLGWAIADDRDVFTTAELVAAFDLSRVSANPARFDLRGLVDEQPGAATLRKIAPLVQQRCVVLSDAVGMLRFLFTAEEDFAVDPDAAAKTLGPTAAPVLQAALDALERAPEWTAQAIEQALKSALVEGLALSPRKAFAPVRVAVTGHTVSPPLYESMELLGRDRSLRRLRSAVALGRGE